MGKHNSSTRERPDAWLSSVMSGRVSQAHDYPAPRELEVPALRGRLQTNVDDIFDLVDRLRVRLQEERAIKDELLAACKAMLAHMESWRVAETADGDMARCRAALAKAEGRS